MGIKKLKQAMPEMYWFSVGHTSSASGTGMKDRRRTAPTQACSLPLRCLEKGLGEECGTAGSSAGWSGT